jgi:hypothetical protein
MEVVPPNKRLERSKARTIGAGPRAIFLGVAPPRRVAPSPLKRGSLCRWIPFHSHFELSVAPSIAHEQFIKQAISLARQARDEGNHPFGALLVLDGDVVLTA